MAKQVPMMRCPRCLCDDLTTVDMAAYPPRYKCEACRCFIFSEAAGIRAWERARVTIKHSDVDRSDLVDPTGKYAIIRPDSTTGHSPSTRYKTKKNAEEAASRLLLASSNPGSFEVVRIVSRVTTQNQVRVINVK